jgi:hypothetical protein
MLIHKVELTSNFLSEQYTQPSSLLNSYVLALLGRVFGFASKLARLVLLGCLRGAFA